MNQKPLIVHVVYRLDTGGMEHVLVTVINQTGKQYRHAVICLAGYGALRARIEDAHVPCVVLNKKPGKDWGCYVRLWKAFRKLEPDLVHSYNIGALDAAPVARLAGVRRVVHSERGRDASDPHGENCKYRMMRRLLSPFIDRFLTVSKDLQDWLTGKVGIDPSRVVLIVNGIDTANYVVSADTKEVRPILGAFAPPGSIVIGNVGRLDPVKDQEGLICAFDLLCKACPEVSERLRLVIVGEGSHRSVLETHIKRLGLAGQVRLLGHRNDVPSILSEFDVFALSSIAEGMPGVLLEAMAAGLPVVATDVGGVGEVVSPSVTGRLVAAQDRPAMAEALAGYVSDEVLRSLHGKAGRDRVQSRFELGDMISAYVALYDNLLHGRSAVTSHADAARQIPEREEK